MTGNRLSGVCLLGFGVTQIAAGIFPPDPMNDFPPGSGEVDTSMIGILHFAFGGLGFILVAIAAFSVSRWVGAFGFRGLARYSVATGILILSGLFAGAVPDIGAPGVVGLWVAVLAMWLWLAVTSVTLYRSVPHPDTGEASLELA